jgi:hypothetical protein
MAGTVVVYDSNIMGESDRIGRIETLASCSQLAHLWITPGRSADFKSLPPGVRPQIFLSHRGRSLDDQYRLRCKASAALALS